MTISRECMLTSSYLLLSTPTVLTWLSSMAKHPFPLTDNTDCAIAQWMGNATNPTVLGGHSSSKAWGRRLQSSAGHTEHVACILLWMVDSKVSSADKGKFLHLMVEWLVFYLILKLSLNILFAWITSFSSLHYHNSKDIHLRMTAAQADRIQVQAFPSPYPPLTFPFVLSSILSSFLSFASSLSSSLSPFLSFFPFPFLLFFLLWIYTFQWNSIGESKCFLCNWASTEDSFFVRNWRLFSLPLLVLGPHLGWNCAGPGHAASVCEFVCTPVLLCLEDIVRKGENFRGCLLHFTVNF